MGRRLDELLASGRLGNGPLRFAEPLFARAEACWTSRPLTFGGDAARAPFVVAVAGAVRGGSWKTPLTVALAEALASRGLSACWLGRGFRAEAPRDGFLADDEDAARAGDEAFASRRSLASAGVAVGVARTWERGLAMVARTAEHAVVLLDGCRQRVPLPRGRSLVAVDGSAAGATAFPRVPGPPLGLGVALSREDRWIVPVVDERTRAVPEPFGATYDLRFDRAIDPAEARRALLVTTHARPDRLVEALRRRGLSPRAHLALRDHASGDDVRRGLASLPRGGGFSLVLAADKAALALSDVALPAPLVLVSCALSPAPALVDALVDAAGKFCR